MITNAVTGVRAFLLVLRWPVLIVRGHDPRATASTLIAIQHRMDTLALGPGALAGLVLGIGSSLRVLRDGRERPREVIYDRRHKVVERSAKRRRRPPPGVGRHVEAPQLSSLTA